MYITTKKETILTREDGSEIRHDVYTDRKHWQTKKAWEAQRRKLRRTAQGQYMQWYISKSRTKGAKMYEEAETLPMTERETARYERKQKEERKQKRAEAKARKLAEEERRKWWDNACTAWQWLAWHHRYPNPDAEYRQADNGWWYCTLADTYEVDDAEYEQLKTAYIKKYGGWEHIDLADTAYTGRAWT